MDFTQKKTLTMKKADMKIVLLGDMNVGKTSLVLRYIDKRFQETISTIGASFLIKQWGNYNVAIWDTAGEEKYQGLNLFYCRNISAALLVFDLTERSTFNLLSMRYLPLLDSVDGYVVKILVGAKLDLLESKERQVSKSEGEDMARSLNESYCLHNPVPYFETSSCTGVNVDQAFETIFEYFFPLHGSQPRNSTKTPIEFHRIDSSNLCLSKSTVIDAKKRTCCY